MAPKKRVTARELIDLIPGERLEALAEESGVDKHVKKLWGVLMFKLLLMGILQSNRVSLRVMGLIYQTPRFRLMHGLPEESKTSHSSLSDRLATMKVSFFENIFDECHALLEKYCKKKEVAKRFITRYDSTTLSASAKLLKTGMVNGLKNKKGDHGIHQVKLTVGFGGALARNVRFFNEQKHLAEDITLRDAILASQHGKDSVIVFDRGLKKRKTFVEFCEEEILFVTRVNPTQNYDVISTHAKVKGKKTETLELLSDEWVCLYHEAKKKVKTPFRLIKAKRTETGETIYFLTNIEDLDTVDITEIYKRRWDIEVFFRFLKQELNLKHFVSYNENGIRIMMYMTLIAAMLFLTYKKLNQLQGYKIPLMKFIEELDAELMKEVVAFCGGNPQLVNRLYGP